MTHAYKSVGWNRQKKIYDRVLLGGVALYLLVFLGLGFVLHPDATAETLVIRALGTCALLLLHVILSIGPLCRLDRRFLPWLYNRRHLGVTMFVLALGHGAFSLFQFHALGDRDPLTSVLSPEQGWTVGLAEFPFQPLGVAALAILFLMAATSHDFWLANLTAPVWKRMHMLVYVAYALIVGHVALGVLQSENSPLLAGAMAVGLGWVLAIQLAAGWRERLGDVERTGPADTGASPPAPEGWVDACAVDEILDGRARTVTIAGDRVAIFRYDGKISALSNACQHQNGPLGEGRIVNGCVVCPWHGYEYRPESGQSPPPFTERVPTFNVKLAGGRVWIDPRPNPAGTRVEPAAIEDGARPAPPADASRGGFYVGYRKESPPELARFTGRAAVGVLVGSAGLAALLTASQSPFAEATFEFGQTRTLTGVVRADPYPVLDLFPPGAEPGGDQSREGLSRILLVARGKFGADSEIEAVTGRPATVEGSLIYRGDLTALELAPGSAQAMAGDASEGPAEVSLGVHTLRGEIVDSKCYLGVMKPGRAKPHKACAINCIRGGIPPLFVVTDAAGRQDHLLLVDAQGLPVNRRVLSVVAEPLEITGEVSRRENFLYLAADPESYNRIAER